MSYCAKCDIEYLSEIGHRCAPSAPQASQPPQGAWHGARFKRIAHEGGGESYEMIHPGVWRPDPPLAAPPQGADRKFQIGDAVIKIKGSNWSGRVVGTYSTELTPEGYAVESSTERGSVQIYPASALAASPLPAPQEPAARFLLVAMDDDGCGNPVFCADEKAVRAALAPLLFFFNDEHPLDAENEASVDAHLESLLEDGFLNFEGDPGITLYKLHAAPAPDSTP